MMQISALYGISDGSNEIIKIPLELFWIFWLLFENFMVNFMKLKAIFS